MSLFVSIRKEYKDFALAVSFESEQGILGFLGASGCGKSMTLKCIAGIEKPDAGKIILNGVTLFDSEKKINLPPQKRKVGYLFQNFALFPNMTVRENVLCGLCREKDTKKKKLLAAQMIDKMALGGLEGHKPYQLSGGQQQRTALARILVNQPEILLLDEPFSALDVYLKLQLENEMRGVLKEFGRDVILVSHSRDEIYRICGDVAVMEKGKILGKGAVKDIFQNPGSRYGAMLTGCKNIVDAKKTGEHEIYVPAWNMHFITEQTVEENLCAIGIRAHAFKPETAENKGKVIFVDEVEEPFEWIVKFRYEGGREDSEPIWWRISKENYSREMPAFLGVSANNIMLLYQ